MNIITNGAYSFREVTDKDHEWLVELHNDPLVLRNITNPTPITMESHLNWWNLLNPEKEKRFIFCVYGERVGFVKFYTIDKVNNNCLLGADIHADYRGRRFAKPMWRLMLTYAFDVLQLHRVSLTVAKYNHVAINVYYGVGFELEGTLNQSLYRDGEYKDQYFMGLTRSQRDASFL